METKYCIAFEDSCGYGVDWYDTEESRKYSNTKGVFMHFTVLVEDNLSDDDITEIVDNEACKLLGW